jgi:predicted homoserine dehydrogenase-like protein
VRQPDRQAAGRERVPRRHQPAVGTTRGFSGDVVATAKRDLKAGERLDGEGGYTVYGMLATDRPSSSPIRW